MSAYDFADKHPGWTLAYLIVIAIAAVFVFEDIRAIARGK